VSGLRRRSPTLSLRAVVSLISIHLCEDLAGAPETVRLMPSPRSSDEPPKRARPVDGAGARRCNTGATLMRMPTRHRRHAITETPPVKAALDELREQLGDARIEFGELVILGAQQKAAQLRAAHDETAARRRALAERLRRRGLPVDRDAADDVRRAGWARP
jgi:hypothetical protein